MCLIVSLIPLEYSFWWKHSVEDMVIYHWQFVDSLDRNPDTFIWRLFLLFQKHCFPSKHWVLGLIPIFWRSFTTVTMQCYCDFPSLDQLHQYKTVSSNKICIQRIVIENVTIHLKYTFTYLFLLEIVSGLTLIYDLSKPHWCLVNCEMFAASSVIK